MVQPDRMFDELNHLIDEQKSWCAPFMFNESIEDEDPVYVDICSVLRKGGK
jgi:hypothetical protein